MLSNYLKVAVRNLWRHKFYSLINVTGLAVGMAVCLMIVLWVRHELSYDRHHEHAAQIYRIALDGQTPEGDLKAPATQGALAPALRNEVPEVVAAARFFFSENLVSYEDRSFYEKRCYWTDPEVFEVFTLPFVQGDPETALDAPNSVVLTEETARRYFGTEDPLGRTIRVDNATDYVVTGVLRELPGNVHFKFGFLGSLSTLKVDQQDPQAYWINHTYAAYLRLQEGTDPSLVEGKIDEIVERQIGEMLKMVGARFSYFLQPLTDIHLHSHLSGELEPNSHIAYVYVFSAIAAFILLIACINFMNLATARSAGRAREVGVRKVVGAGREQLVGQFLGESTLVCLLALVGTLMLIEVLLPFFNELAGKSLDLNYGQEWTLLAGLVGMALGAGLLAGIYPAFFLSAFLPASVLKGAGRAGVKGRRFRSALVITQFAVSIGLIVGTLIITEQMDYLRTKNLGFDKENVVAVDLRTEEIRNGVEALKADFVHQPGVISAGASNSLPGWLQNKTILWQKGSQPEDMVMVSQMLADYDFAQTLGMRLVEGRNFSREFGVDAEGVYIVNQTAAAMLGEGSAVGKEIGYLQPPPQESIFHEVVGVVEDFHFQPLHAAIEPLVLQLAPNSMVNANGSFRHVVVRIRPGDVQGTLAFLEGTWKKHAGSAPFEYRFLDEELDQLYRAEMRLEGVFKTFSGLAIFIACLGLFGLASFTAEQRTKEIGIRKTLGASVISIVLLLSREFTWLVLAANLVAWPAAYFGMRKWLESFAYRVELGAELFVLGGIAALAVAWLTVSYQAVRAALTNPVEALRYE